jgi:hypothetical protein
MQRDSSQVKPRVSGEDEEEYGDEQLSQPSAEEENKRESES